MILVDTSIWVDHFKAGDEGLSEQLSLGRVLGHPFVIGELALGSLRQRDIIIGNLHGLPQAPVTSNSEVLHFIEENALAASGIGLVDVHLLASVALIGTARLWTRDRRLGQAARRLGLAQS